MKRLPLLIRLIWVVGSLWVVVSVPASFFGFYEVAIPATLAFFAFVALAFLVQFFVWRHDWPRAGRGVIQADPKGVLDVVKAFYNAASSSNHDGAYALLHSDLQRVQSWWEFREQATSHSRLFNVIGSRWSVEAVAQSASVEGQLRVEGVVKVSARFVLSKENAIWRIAAYRIEDAQDGFGAGTIPEPQTIQARQTVLQPQIVPQSQMEPWAGRLLSAWIWIGAVLIILGLASYISGFLIAVKFYESMTEGLALWVSILVMLAAPLLAAGTFCVVWPWGWWLAITTAGIVLVFGIVIGGGTLGLALTR